MAVGKLTTSSEPALEWLARFAWRSTACQGMISAVRIPRVMTWVLASWPAVMSATAFVRTTNASRTPRVHRELNAPLFTWPP